MKIFLLLLIVLSFSPTSSQADDAEVKEFVQENGCQIRSKELLMCEALMCSIGILIAESRSECLKIQGEVAVYIATLGFWDNPPKCKSRNSDCSSAGRANTNEQLADTDNSEVNSYISETERINESVDDGTMQLDELALEDVDLEGMAEQQRLEEEEKERLRDVIINWDSLGSL